jgi:hypothetical protein
VVVCDPRHPQQNGFVERYNRSYQQECLAIHRPTSFSEVCEATETFVEHYNWQRPHQGIACGNRPPRVAFPDLPSLRHLFLMSSTLMPGWPGWMGSMWYAR